MSQLHFLFNFTLSSRKIESFRVVGWRPWPVPPQPFQLIWPKLILKICTKLWPIIASILQNTFDRTKYYIFTLQVPTRVVTTVPAKEPRLDQQPIKSALKKVLLIVSYMFDTDYFTKEKVLPFLYCAWKYSPSIAVRRMVEALHHRLKIIIVNNKE